MTSSEIVSRKLHTFSKATGKKIATEVRRHRTKRNTTRIDSERFALRLEDGFRHATRNLGYQEILQDTNECQNLHFGIN